MPPLHGLRVLECGIAIAGPLAARYLAHAGAEVIKLEHRAPEGPNSVIPAWAPRDIGPAGADLFPNATLNAEKLSLSLDLKAGAARAPLERLIALTDVFVTNMSVPALESLRITYKDLRPLNPALIYISMPGFGPDPGPYRDYRSWGPNLSSLAGIDFLTGDADRDPVMTPTPLVDYVCAYQAVSAILAAVLHRAHTGDGQEIRLAQFETAISLLGPQIVDYQLTGCVPARGRNSSPVAAPSDLFPCRGHDRWLSIEVFSDAEWLRLTEVEGMPAALREPALRSSGWRIAAADRIRELLSEWTSRRTDREAAEALRRVGIAAHPAQSSWDHVYDAQLEARGFWKVVGHDRLGADLAPALPIQLERTPFRYTSAAPAYGRDTREILTRLAGLTDTEVDALVAARVAVEAAPLPATIPAGSLQRPSVAWAWPLLRVVDAAEERSTDITDAAHVPPDTNLQSTRVLDLSDALSAYGTHLLALLGAEVVRVEPPGGATIRQHPPLAGSTSSYQLFTDARKRSVVLDVETEEGRARLERLVRSADILYESLPPGTLARLGFSWEHCRSSTPVSAWYRSRRSARPDRTATSVLAN